MKNTIPVFLGMLSGILLLLTILALPTYLLWNWLMPEIFDLKEISFFQALGLNILSYILFKINIKVEKE